jgi:hypothetical protein
MYLYACMYVRVTVCVCVYIYSIYNIYIYIYIVRTFRNVVSTAEVAIRLGKKEDTNPDLNF